MKNQPERLQEREQALRAFRAGVDRGREEAMLRHHRHQQLVVDLLADPDLHIVARVCECQAFPWKHAKQISRRCLGR